MGDDKLHFPKTLFQKTFPPPEIEEPFNRDPKYNICNDYATVLGDVFLELRTLEKFKIKERTIIRRLIEENPEINIDNSTITPIHLDPSVAHPLERSIIDYPQVFELSSFSRFINRKRISISNSSIVISCVNRFNGKSFVIKRGIKPRSEHRYLTDSSRAIINEVKILTLIGRHVHIVDYYDSWIEDESYRIQLELVRGGSLLDFIIGNKKMLATVFDKSHSSKMQLLSDCSAFILLAQMSSVLAYLHDYLHVVHGNIEPSNILVDLCKYETEDTKGECHKALLQSDPNQLLRFKLCDFSQSGVRDPPIQNHLPYSTDIQSLGLTIYQCFGGVINLNILMEIRNGHVLDNLSIEWRLIIQKMCRVNEINRFTALEIIEMDNVKVFVLPESSRHLQYEADANGLQRLKWTHN